MKILYLSAHAILEFDELKLFEELGYDYFSLGSYLIPDKPVDAIRPALTHKVDQDLLAVAPAKDDLPRDFINKFDVIIVMHVPEWIERNWHKMKHKRVIWRTIGQSTPALEKKMKVYRDGGLEIIRYSPREERIENYVGGDAMIRFYKDQDEFSDYTGAQKRVITFSQNIKHRAEYCCYDTVMKVLAPFGDDAKIFGRDNENLGKLFGGYLTYDQMRQAYRDNRVYLYGGTQPASYTLNFMEAFMTGIPVVALGSKFANSLNIAGDTYEIPDFITNGVNGYCSDDVEVLQEAIRFLLDNPRKAKQVGLAGRHAAIELFGKEKVKSLWKEYLEK